MTPYAKFYGSSTKDLIHIRRSGDVDYLQQNKESFREVDPSEGLEVADHALEGELITLADGQEEEYSTAEEDKEGCSSSFSSFISSLFCLR